MNTKFLNLLCLVAFLCSFNLSGQNIPGSVNIIAEKKVLRPGETTRITLNNFRNKSNQEYKPDTTVMAGDRIIVSCSAGQILDGTAWNNYDPEIRPIPIPGIASYKIFWLGNNDRVEFYYRAPLRPKEPKVEISAYCSVTNVPLEEVSLNESEDGYLLNSTNLKLLLDTYMLLQYREEKQEYMGSKTYKKYEITSVVRIDCEPWAIGNSLRVKEFKVLEIQGRAEKVTSQDHLQSTATTAKPSAYNSLVMLSLNPGNGSVEGIIYTPVPLKIDWRGDDIPEGPPDVIQVGPVSEDERGDLGARWEGSILVDEFGKFPENRKVSTEERQRIREKQATLLLNFSETQVHPDFMVKGGNNKTFYSGKGEWEDKNKSGGNYFRKTFNWELYLEE